MVRIVIKGSGLTTYSYDYTHAAWTNTRQIVLCFSVYFPISFSRVDNITNFQIAFLRVAIKHGVH